VEPLAFEPQWLISPPLLLFTFHLVSFSKLQNSMTTYMDPVLFTAAEAGNIDQCVWKSDSFCNRGW